MSLYREPDGRFAIRGPDDQHDCVEFWSAKRLSFDNKREWEKRLVGDLAERLRRLADTRPGTQGDGRWLRAVFATEDPIDCDAGNLAYLNVGSRPFVGLGHRISFERWYESPEAPVPIAWETSHRYYHGYSLGSSPGPERWRRGRPLAAWQDLPCDSLTGDQAARRVWLAMRRHPALITVEALGAPWTKTYGVSIQVAFPEGRPVMPAGILEAVLDGCLASFHRDTDHVRAAQVAAKLSEQLAGIDPAELVLALTGAGSSLFPGPPFGLHPTFVQLSPGDERCLFGSLEVLASEPHSGRSLTGEIFALEQWQ